MNPNVPTLATCRLCHSNLREYELEMRLCSTCESHAEQMGVRNAKELEEVVAELAAQPLFRATT